MAFENPKMTMNDKIIDVEWILNLKAANSGKMDLSIPIIAPTKAFTTINNTN
jgi:hypothetical protein